MTVARYLRRQRRRLSPVLRLGTRLGLRMAVGLGRGLGLMMRLGLVQRRTGS